MAQDNDMDLGLSPEIKRLSDQLARDPNSKLFIPLAEEYMKSDMAEEAVMTLEEGLKAHPAYMSARVLLGKAHLMAGDMDKACEQFENVIKAVPDNLFALKKLGEIYLAQGRREESLKNFRILALLSPKDEELTSMISRLEAGELPPSPLSAIKPPAADEAATSGNEEISLDEAAEEAVSSDTSEVEEEPVEGAAPVYEIGDEELADIGVDSLSEPSEQLEYTSRQAGAEDVPEPEPSEPSPFDLGADVPYQAGDSEAMDLDRIAGGEEPAQPAAGGPDAEESVKTGPSPSDELQDIFSSFTGGGDEAPAGEEAGVYELEEPSDLDLEQLGVKTQSAPEPAAEEEEAFPSDMPFELEGEMDKTVPSDFALELPEEGESGEDLPFDIMAGDEVGLEDISFETAEGSDVEQHGAPAAIPDAEKPADMPPDDESAPFETGEDILDFGIEAEPEPPSGEMDALSGAEEPAVAREQIKTGTLAEMYIRQGFYDRAIDIYKEMLRESPGNTDLRQKLEELYMLADVNSAMSAPEEAPGQVEPADFVMEAGLDAEEAAPFKPAVVEEPPVAKHAGESHEVVGRLEKFLEDIKRKAGQ